jgi:energy-coupling factor transporter transmembrane protein EcfT
MINAKIKLTTFVVVFGMIILFLRVYNCANGLWWPNLEIVILPIIFIILLGFTLKEAFKRKRISSLVLLASFILVAIFFPFEYVIGIINFRTSEKARNQIVQNLRVGYYDSTLKENEFQKEGTWVENTKKIRVYKDDTLQLVFFRQSFYWQKTDYCGILYISGDRYLKDKKVYGFLNNEFEFKKFDENWYWIIAYVPIEPGP